MLPGHKTRGVLNRKWGLGDFHEEPVDGRYTAPDYAVRRFPLEASREASKLLYLRSFLPLRVRRARKRKGNIVRVVDGLEDLSHGLVVCGDGDPTLGVYVQIASAA